MAGSNVSLVSLPALPPTWKFCFLFFSMAMTVNLDLSLVSSRSQLELMNSEASGHLYCE
jgi:hypothetical protein